MGYFFRLSGSGYLVLLRVFFLAYSIYSALQKRFVNSESIKFDLNFNMIFA